MIRKILHKIYLFVGRLLTNIRLCFWRLRDKIKKPTENTVLFVAHPDDDALFFHEFIKEHKPYVVLLTTGWSLRRYPCFKKVMKYYGVKYRAYNLNSRDKRVHLLEKYVSEMLTLLNPQICATHNSEGEYGHEMHVGVHNVVRKLVNCKLLVPVSDSDIVNFPLSDDIVKEKTMIFNKFYTTEIFVLEQYGKWVENEKLIEVE